MIESPPPLRTIRKQPPNGAVEPTYVSISQAAVMLGVSRVTIWRWIRAGRLQARRFGHRTVRIDRAEIDAALACCDGADGPPWPVHERAVGPLAPNPVDRADAEHVVQFYESDAYLVDSVAAYV